MVKEHYNEFTLCAAETDWQLEMPLSHLVATIIDTATAHANRLGIGFDTLRKSGASWVLSRLCISLDEMPSLGHTYRLHTWIHDWNRIYSQRCFRLEEVDSGRTIGWFHSVWMAIDLETRRPVDLPAMLGPMDDAMCPDKPFEGCKCGRIAPLASEEYGFERIIRVSDIDINRHLTTTRYIEMLVDLWPIEHYTENRISGFEIAFKHEILYGSVAKASRLGNTAQIQAEGTVCSLSAFTFSPRRQ